MWEEEFLNMNNQVLSKTERERDIGVIIHKSLKPSLQCSVRKQPEKQIAF